MSVQVILNALQFKSYGDRCNNPQTRDFPTWPKCGLSLPMTLCSPSRFQACFPPRFRPRFLPKFLPGFLTAPTGTALAIAPQWKITLWQPWQGGMKQARGAANVAVRERLNPQKFAIFPIRPEPCRPQPKRSPVPPDARTKTASSVNRAKVRGRNFRGRNPPSDRRPCINVLYMF